MFIPRKNYFWAFFLLLCVLCRPSGIWANELQCNVMINAQTIQSNVDQTFWQNMQRALTEYMNNTKWTEDKFEPIEKIRCTINIMLTSMPSNDRFEGTAQIQAIRPVLNSSFETQLINFNDQNFVCNYIPQQALQYTESSYVNNLTSLLNFYALIILGMDYASFSLEGGNPFFERARNVLNLAASGGERGWGTMDSPTGRNRFWLIENLTNNTYKKFHNVLYTYHRKGLDVMHEDVNKGRSAILESIIELQRLYQDNQQLFIVRIFMDAKSNEIIQIFRNGQAADKQRLVQILKIIDTNNASKYDELLKENTGSR
jgi:hypothetical protein